MPYIGNEVGNRFVASKAASVYSGNGSTTAFTLEHAVGSDEDILVSVDGVIQEPSVAYAVSSGTTLTFTAAPSSNSGNNIFVYYLFRTVATVDHPSTSSLQATDGTFTAGITGTLQTAAQTNITSVGTLTGFTSTGIDDNADATAITIDSNEDITITKQGTNTTDLRFANSSNSYGGNIKYDHNSGIMKFDVHNSERLAINASGNVGISVSSPQELLHIKDGSIVVGNGTASNNAVIGRIGFSTDSSNSRFIGMESFRGGDAANGDLRFHTFGGDGDNGERVRIHTNGVLSASDGIALGVGTANTASNVLDDYEEGTWTPVLEGSGTTSGVAYSRRQGRYTKVGDKVFVNFHIVLSDEGSISSTAKISGLPFSGNGEPLYQVCHIMSGNMALDKDQMLTGMQYAANAFIYLMIQESDLALSQVTGNGSFKDNSEMVGMCTYYTNS